jgi:hypothetical protein
MVVSKISTFLMVRDEVNRRLCEAGIAASDADFIAASQSGYSDAIEFAAVCSSWLQNFWAEFLRENPVVHLSVNRYFPLDQRVHTAVFLLIQS